VIVVDNCEKAPVEAREFIRRIVERAAGMAGDRTSVDEADKGLLRVVLLGDSSEMLPANVYSDNLLEENLTDQVLGPEQLAWYFKAFAECRSIDLSEARTDALITECCARAQEIAAPVDAPAIAWPEALARAVIEKTLPLEALAAQKQP
jgi:hypothetical protein